MAGENLSKPDNIGRGSSLRIDSKDEVFEQTRQLVHASWDPCFGGIKHWDVISEGQP